MLSEITEGLICRAIAKKDYEQIHYILNNLRKTHPRYSQLLSILMTYHQDTILKKLLSNYLCDGKENEILIKQILNYFIEESGNTIEFLKMNEMNDFLLEHTDILEKFLESSYQFQCNMDFLNIFFKYRKIVSSSFYNRMCNQILKDERWTKAITQLLEFSKSDEFSLRCLKKLSQLNDIYETDIILESIIKYKDKLEIETIRNLCERLCPENLSIKQVANFHQKMKSDSNLKDSSFSLLLKSFRLNRDMVQTILRCGLKYNLDFDDLYYIAIHSISKKPTKKEFMIEGFLSLNFSERKKLENLICSQKDEQLILEMQAFLESKEYENKMLDPQKVSINCLSLNSGFIKPMEELYKYLEENRNVFSKWSNEEINRWCNEILYRLYGRKEIYGIFDLNLEWKEDLTNFLLSLKEKHKNTFKLESIQEDSFFEDSFIENISTLGGIYQVVGFGEIGIENLDSEIQRQIREKIVKKFIRTFSIILDTPFSYGTKELCGRELFLCPGNQKVNMNSNDIINILLTLLPKVSKDNNIISYGTGSVLIPSEVFIADFFHFVADYLGIEIPYSKQDIAGLLKENHPQPFQKRKGRDKKPRF